MAPINPARVPSGLGRFYRTTRRIRGLLAFGALICLLLLVGTVVLNVVLRYGFGSPLPGTIEYVSYWYMVPIAFLSFGLTESADEHIDAPILSHSLSKGLQRELFLLGRAMFVIVMVAIAWWGWQEAVTMYEIGERGGAAGTPIWPTRFFVPIGAIACALEAVLAMVREIQGYGAGVSEGSDGGHLADADISPMQT